MDIRVGGGSRIGAPADSTPGPKEQIEAKILAIRHTRNDSRPARKPSAERRTGRTASDPRGGRILVLMIPDGQQLPQGLETGGYRVFLRFVRR